MELLPADLGDDWLIGHRGAARWFPENTLGGVEAAAETGVKWVELDVTWLKDGTAVINHDDSIDRCSDGRGKLLELSLDDVADINNAATFPEWPQEPLPTLEQMLDLLIRLNMGLNLEIKPNGANVQEGLPDVLDMLKAAYPESERLIISSFDMEAMALCRELAPQLRRGLLFDQLPANWRPLAEERDAYSLHLDWKYLNYAQAREIREAGYHLYCWTVNDAKASAGFWQWGVNGIITDDPVAIYKAYDR